MDGIASEGALPVGPGETVAWSGRPRPLIGLPSRVIPAAVVGAVVVALLVTMGASALFILACLALWLVIVFVPYVYGLWRLRRTRYALTERNLYVTVDGLLGGTTAFRLTALDHLIVVDEGSGVGSVALRTRPYVDRPMTPAWLLPRPDVILFAIPDARGVKARIEALRDARQAGSTLSGTAISATPRGKDRSDLALYAVGLGFVLISLILILLILSAGDPGDPGLVVPAILLLGTFLVAGLVMLAAPFVLAWRARAFERTSQLGFATVTDVRGRLHHDDDSGPDGVVEYRYDAMGRTYTGRATGLGFEEARRVGVGDPILIRFDPSDPGHSIWAVR